MKKELILVVFPTLDRGINYVEDNILPLVSNLKKLNKNTYYSDSYELRIASLINIDNIRGLYPSLVFLSEDCPSYNYSTILELVKGEHRKIKVVI